MIFFANAEGNITKVIPEPIYQNSHRANEIVLVAPYTKASVTVAFTLPNGTNTSLNLATPNMAQIDLTGIQTANGEQYNAWRYLIPRTITEYVGEVGVQFYIYNGTVTSADQTTGTADLDLVILATLKTKFSVLRGVKYIPPTADATAEVPIYDQIMAYLSELETTFSEGSIVSTAPLYEEGQDIPVTLNEDRTAFVRLQSGGTVKTKTFSGDTILTELKTWLEEHFDGFLKGSLSIFNGVVRYTLDNLFVLNNRLFLSGASFEVPFGDITSDVNRFNNTLIVFLEDGTLYALFDSYLSWNKADEISSTAQNLDKVTSESLTQWSAIFTVVYVE